MCACSWCSNSGIFFPLISRHKIALITDTIKKHCHMATPSYNVSSKWLIYPWTKWIFNQINHYQCFFNIVPKRINLQPFKGKPASSAPNTAFSQNKYTTSGTSKLPIWFILVSVLTSDAMIHNCQFKNSSNNKNVFKDI